MTSVAVTGATGRIGSALLELLLQKGYTVRALTRADRPPRHGVTWVRGDLLDPSSLARLVEGTTRVFHAGGQLSGDPAAVEESLVTGTANVLQAARDQRVVHLSSLVVVRTAIPSSRPLDEQAMREPHPERRGVYTQSKCAAEALAQAAAATQDVVIVRPGLVMAEHPDLPASIGWRRGNVVVLVGPANGLMPTVEVADVAKGLLLAAEQLPRGEVLQLVDPELPTRLALLQRIARDRGESLRVVRAGGVLLPLARLASLSGIPAIARPAYRLLSAAAPQKWSAAKALSIGWSSSVP